MKKTIILSGLFIVALFFVGVVSNISMHEVAFAQGLEVPTAPTEPVTDTSLANNPIVKWIEFFVNVLAVTILAGASVMIAWAGIQYMSARDNAQGVQAAKQKIWNVIIGLLAYFFLYGFIQWLIPGGVF